MSTRGSICRASSLPHFPPFPRFSLSLPSSKDISASHRRTARRSPESCTDVCKSAVCMVIPRPDVASPPVAQDGSTGWSSIWSFYEYLVPERLDPPLTRSTAQHRRHQLLNDLSAQGHAHLIEARLSRSDYEAEENWDSLGPSPIVVQL